MFLGGVERAFTDDLPPEQTFVGFHGHYRSDGTLDTALVQKLGLESWIIRFTDGKADPELVHRWVSIGRAQGTASFYPISVAPAAHPLALFCDASFSGPDTFSCEALATDARRMGITTTEAPIHSHTPPLNPGALRATGWAGINEADKLPTRSDRIRAQYLNFLAHPPPRLFALSLNGEHFAWRAGTLLSAQAVLDACSSAAAQPCRVYATDKAVVWTAD